MVPRWSLNEGGEAGVVAPSYEVLEVSAGEAASVLTAMARSHPAVRDAVHVSRSYRAPLAVVAWHDTPVGVDIERMEALGRPFAESICTPEERDQLGELLDDDAVVSSLWSGKEALAKVLGDAVDYDPRRLYAPLLWLDGACGRWRAALIDAPAGHVGWLVWRA